MEQKILKSARDNNKLAIIRVRLSRNTGRIFEGRLPQPEWAEKNLGETYDKTVLASKGVEQLGKNKNSVYTVLGGWCAIRTKCLREIGEGILTDPVTGKKKQIKTVSQVAQWIQNAVSLDQIVETIGIYNGTNYVAISEEKLWTKKVINTLELYFNRELTDNEKQNIFIVIKTAEEIRYKITKKYIEYVSGHGISLTRVFDSDIYDDLIQGRNILFEKVGISINDLVEPMILRILKRSDSELQVGTKTRNDLLNYIDNSTLVWYMYTGDYLELLKKKNYVNTPNGIIIEPWSHAVSNESEAKFNTLIFTGKNSYLHPGGVNENLAYIAIDEASNYNWKSYKSQLSIAEIPNIQNYKIFFEKNTYTNTFSNLELAKNLPFMYGVNFLPYGKCRKLLLEIISVNDEYRLKLKENKNKYNDYNNGRKNKIQQLKKTYSAKMVKLSKQIDLEIRKMINSIFS